jgi:hypothetical protein
VDKVALGQVFLRELWFPSVSIIPSMPHIPIHLRLYYLKDKRAKRGGPSEGNALPEILGRKVLPFFFVLQRLTRLLP